jgi:CBS domain-containing protein
MATDRVPLCRRFTLGLREKHASVAAPTPEEIYERTKGEGERRLSRRFLELAATALPDVPAAPSLETLAGVRVTQAMVTRPTVYGPATTVGELRACFRDDHVHMALLVDAGKLVAAVDRADLGPHLSDDSRARFVTPLRGRTVGPDASLADALETMRQTRRRRLAVVDEDGTLLGLLCLKATGLGFCSDDAIAQRRRAQAGSSRLRLDSLRDVPTGAAHLGSILRAP